LEAKKMRRIHVWAMALFTPILGLALVAGLGCGSKPEATEEEAKTESPNKGGGGKGGASKAAKTEVKGDYTGTLKGKVSFKGTKPDLTQINKDILAQMEKTDKAHCIEGASEAEKTQQKWRISDDGGLANVVVWIQPKDKNQFFKVDQSKKTWQDQVVLDQPHCAFVPHVSILFPQFIDPATKKVAKTGQTFLVKNSAQTNHNTKTPDDNATITAGSQKEFSVSQIGSAVPINCTIHPWMNAWVWAFDHPYAALTDKDGNYEIKNVPVGATVKLRAWQEEVGNIPSKDGVDITLEPTTTKNFDAENNGN
jgi:hypothetical protein